MTGQVDKIRRAHENGQLFVHLFEFSNDVHETPAKSINLDYPIIFNVMKGDPKTTYITAYHKISGHPQEGFIGLPCTALKKGYPVQLYRLADRLGIILDGEDEKHVKPLMVGSSDLCSHTKDGKLGFSPKEMFPELEKLQRTKESTVRDIAYEFKIDRDLDAMKARGKKAMPIFWNGVHRRGWRRYSDMQTMERGMNEISVAAHINGVRGLLVRETISSQTSYNENEEQYKRAVKNAVELRDWLQESYPDTFPEKLPILSYNPNREHQQLIELTEDKLQNPSMPQDEPPTQTQEHRRGWFSGR